MSPRSTSAESPIETTWLKPDAFDGGPIEHRQGDGARLRHERDIPGLRQRMREARVEFQARDLDAKAVRADDAQEIRLRRVQHALGQFALDAGRNDDGRLAAFAAELVDDAGYRVWRRGNDREARHEGEGFDAAVAGLAQNGCRGLD